MGYIYPLLDRKITTINSCSLYSPEERAKQLEDNNDVCGVHDDIAKKGQTAVSLRKNFEIFKLVYV